MEQNIPDLISGVLVTILEIDNGGLIGGGSDGILSSRIELIGGGSDGILSSRIGLIGGGSDGILSSRNGPIGGGSDGILSSRIGGGRGWILSLSSFSEHV